MAARKRSGQPTAARTSRRSTKKRIFEALRDGIGFPHVMNLAWKNRDRLLQEMAGTKRFWEPKVVGSLEDEFFDPLESGDRSQLRTLWVHATFRRIVHHVWHNKFLRLSHVEWFIDARLRRRLSPEDAWAAMPWKSQRLVSSDQWSNRIAQIVAGVDPIEAWIAAAQRAGTELGEVDFRYLLIAELAKGRNATALENVRRFDPLKRLRADIQRCASPERLCATAVALRPQLQAVAKGRDWKQVGTLDEEFFNPLESGIRCDLRKAWNRAIYRVVVDSALRGRRPTLDFRQHFIDARLRTRLSVREFWDSITWRGSLYNTDRQCNFLRRVSSGQFVSEAWVRSAEIGGVQIGLLGFESLLVAKLATGAKSTALADTKEFDVLQELHQAIRRKLDIPLLEQIGLALRRQIHEATRAKKFTGGPVEKDFVTVLRFERDDDRFTDEIRIGEEWNKALLRRILRKARHKHDLGLNGRDWFIDGRIRLELDQFAARARVPADLDLFEYQHGGSNKRQCYVDRIIGTRKNPGRRPEEAWEELYPRVGMQVEDIFIGGLAMGYSPVAAAQWAVDETAPGKIKALRRIVG